MLLRDADISAEYPKDVDDENITTQGLSPTLPGELTKISSALALFKASRILAKVLEDLYPAANSYQLSLKKLHTLARELEQWSNDLPTHLRLTFLNDKPSTGVISCRSPLLVSTDSFLHRFALAWADTFIPVTRVLLHTQPYPQTLGLPWR